MVDEILEAISSTLLIHFVAFVVLGGLIVSVYLRFKLTLVGKIAIPVIAFGWYTATAGILSSFIYTNYPESFLGLVVILAPLAGLFIGAIVLFL